MTALTLLKSREFNQPTANKPLAIAVTDDGHFTLQIHALLRQVTPVLEQPDIFPDAYRHELAERAKKLLHHFPDEEPLPHHSNEYELGCWVEEDAATDTPEKPEYEEEPW